MSGMDRPASNLAALASLAFGPGIVRTTPVPGNTRHLAFLSEETLEFDLSDPEQRDFGDYELCEQLGAGGMGVVYRARQKSLDREVAIKLLSAGPWASAEFIERFRREAQSAARLQHPNIVAIHEIGNLGELNYFSMALVHGQNLAQCLAMQGPMAPLPAARLVHTLAEALHYAHRLGVLHLDLKPGNVLIDPQGEPKIADFGLARRIDGSPSLDADEVSGTPSYMAPEQIEPHRHKLCIATDLYGLGSILYELLTGHAPFEADSPEKILSLVLDGQLRHPRRYQPNLPDDLVAICLKCLAKDPGERYPDAQVLANDLGRFLEGRTVSVRPLNMAQRLPRWIRREPRIAGAVSLGALALLIGLGVALFQRERAEESAVAAREHTWRTRGDAALRLVAEGRQVEAMPLLIDNLREREAHGDDGTTLERIRLGSLQSTGAQLIDSIETGGIGRAADVNRTGTRVAVADLAENIRLYDVEDGRLLWQSNVAAYTHFRAAFLPLTYLRFSADGRYLVSSTMEPTTFMSPHGRNNVLIDAIDGRIIVPLEDHFADFVDATYSTDGSHAVLRNRHAGAQFFRVDGWQPLTPLREMGSMGGSWMVGDAGRFVVRSFNHRIDWLDTSSLLPISSVQFTPGAGPRTWATQPGGSLLATGHEDGSVQLHDPTRLDLPRLHPQPSDTVGTITFSEDGQWLLAAAGGRVFAWDVASGSGGIMPSNRMINATRLQGDATSATVFALAPDDAKLWRLPPLQEGSDLRTRISGSHMLVSQFGFDNTLPRNAAAYAPAAGLVANIGRDGGLRLWRWREKQPLRIRAAPLPFHRLDFDGRHVVAVEDSIVRIVELPNEQDASLPLVHPQPVSLAALTPDGQSLVTASGRELRVFDWRKGLLRFEPITLDGTPIRLAIHPDSVHLFVTTGEYTQGRFHELASTVDLRDGKLRASAVPLPGPLTGMRFSADGDHLVHWRYGETEVRHATSLERIANPLHFGTDIANARNATKGIPTSRAVPTETPIIDAAISNDGSHLTLTLSGVEPGTPRLIEASTTNASVLSSQPLPHGVISRFWTRGDGHEFSIWNNLSGTTIAIDTRHGRRLLPQVNGAPLPAQAISQDGRWLAIATTTGASLIDRTLGEWAVHHLEPLLDTDDPIMQLAFATDGSSLLARSHGGRWAWWPLSPDTRPLEQLESHISLLGSRHVAHIEIARTALDADTRRALRADDPGQPATSPRPPARTSWKPWRALATTPGFMSLDLRPALTRQVTASESLSGPAAFVPSGHQRMLGIDFDIAGPIALAMPQSPTAALGSPPASNVVAITPSRIKALHVLIGGCCAMPVHPQGPYAYVLLHYSDGSSTRLPVLHQRDMWIFGNDPGDGAHARIAWVIALPDGLRANIYAPRLTNPHPERDVVGVSFEASEHFASGPLIFAATAEMIASADSAMTLH